MRVLIVNTSENTGGAAIAANRLMDALSNNGVKAYMVVRDKSTDSLRVTGIGGLAKKWDFLWERWCIYVNMHMSREHLFEVDIANSGTDITSLPEFKEADVIHLHWINQGMLSLDNIRRILQSGKPVVWTMHDFWPATAICHYPHECRAYMTRCHNCPYLPGGGSEHDLSAKVWSRKVRMLKDANVTMVACSRWLAGKARSSGLLIGKTVVDIPNPIDTRVYHPGDRRMARRALSLPQDKRLILFVSQRITDPRKGMDYLVQACEALVREHPSMASDAAVVVLGGHSAEVADRLPLPALPLGYVGDTRRIVSIYQAVDAFVLPSLEDNLPNTIMEAMACGVPCVGFDVGGIPEMIDHMHNGYVARYKDADDLAAGIYWVLDCADRASLSDDAVAKVRREYSQAEVAKRYIEVYRQALSVAECKPDL